MSTDQVRPEPPTACFAVRAAADPGTLPRLLLPFAKRGLVPSAMHVRAAGETLLIDLQVPGLGGALAEILAEGLRQTVTVERVLLSTLEAAAA